MSKHRVRVKGGKKGKQRWGKGQSGASNPSKTKFRDAAKSRLLRGQGFGKQTSNLGPLNFTNGHGSAVTESNIGPDIPSKLTAECLLRHEAVLGQVSSSSGGTTGNMVKRYFEGAG